MDEKMELPIKVNHYDVALAHLHGCAKCAENRSTSAWSPCAEGLRLITEYTDALKIHAVEKILGNDNESA